MTGEMDAYPFRLAEALGRTVGELDTMSNREYIGWKSYHTFRAAMADQRSEE